MKLGIENKLAIITASGRGIGRAIAQALAREGVSVIVNSRSQKELEKLVEELSFESPGKHNFFCYDLSSTEGPKELLKFVKKNGLYPDIVVHNLGGNLDISNPLCSLDDWKKVQRINLEVPVELNRELIPFMQKKKWGRICHVSSISGLENQGSPSYCAAKAGLIAYTRSVGRYVSKDGIVINTILPGAIFTDGGYWDEASKKRPDHVDNFLKNRMAIQRFGKMEEISEVTVFLCSQLASFCIGSAFLVDGGQGRVFYEQQ